MIAFLLVILAGIPMAFASFVVVFGNLIERWMVYHVGHEMGPYILGLWTVLRWIIAGLTSIAVIGLIYHHGVPRTQPWHRVLPGSVLATVIWFVATAIFGVYLRRFGHYDVIYGSVATAIALLIWLYIVSMVVLIGAEFNSLAESAFSVWRAFRIAIRSQTQVERKADRNDDRTRPVSRESTTDPFETPAGFRRRAKIVCTIGPASNTEDLIRDLMLRGMNVARLNFSHGTHDDHATVIQRLRKVATELDRTICIMQDLQGPKIRTGRLKDRMPVALSKGQTVTITPKDVMGDSERLSTTYQNLANDVKPGERILLSDGRIELVVQDIRDGEVVCEVLNGGMLGEHQGINLPGTNVSIPSLTEKDLADLEFGLKQGVDLVAISFVRTAEDVLRARRAITQHRSDVGLVAKLEKPQAIENLDAILEVAEAVMVARGDLGVEVAPEKVPLIQKHVIRRALDFRRPVITATQMLESMTESPRPTRAEASDVANAVFDGTDAVMLSGETASGKYPREAVEMMARIVAEVEAHQTNPLLPEHGHAEHLSIAETICESMAHAATDLKIRAIAVFTETATTARMLSKYRPAADIYGFASVPAVCNRMNALWGTTPLPCPEALSVERMAQFAEDELVRRGVLTAGDVFGLVAGTQRLTGATNFMRLITVEKTAK